MKSADGIDGLRRYDASLHEGWYCCRFILMRMVVDKFGTGDALLVYEDAVTAVDPGQQPPIDRSKRAQLKLTARDFDNFLAADHGDKVVVVKFGATWCPPCRLVDDAIERIVAAGSAPNAVWAEVDIDEEHALAERFPLMSVPTIRLYYKGRFLPVKSGFARSVNGAVVGGLGKAGLQRLVEVGLRAGRSGDESVEL